MVYCTWKKHACRWANHPHRVIKRFTETKVPPGTPDAVMAQTGTKRRIRKKHAFGLCPSSNVFSKTQHFGSWIWLSPADNLFYSFWLKLSSDWGQLFLRDPTEYGPSSFSWRWKQEQFPKRCIFFRKQWTMDNKPAFSLRGNVLPLVDLARFVKGVFQSYNEGFTSSTALCKLHLKGILPDLRACLFALV
jgi:hypothetical protein